MDDDHRRHARWTARRTNRCQTVSTGVARPTNQEIPGTVPMRMMSAEVLDLRERLLPTGTGVRRTYRRSEVAKLTTMFSSRIEDC